MTPKVDERTAFLNDVQKFKKQIYHKEDKSIPPNDVEDILQTNAKEENEPSVSNEDINITDKDHTKCKSDDTNEICYSSHYMRPYYLYTIMQTISFVIMAGLVGRMKYMLTPFLCLMDSAFPPKNWFPKSPLRYWSVYLFLVLVSIADSGVQV